MNVSIREAAPLTGGGVALDPPWRDPKRHAWLLGLLVPLLPLVAWALSSLTGLRTFPFANAPQTPDRHLRHISPSCPAAASDSHVVGSTH